MTDKKEYEWLVCTRCYTFNQAPYIVDAMNGFCMQETVFPYICAIVDDASTDGEQEVIKRYLLEHFDINDKCVAKNEETVDYALTFARHKANKNCFFAVLLLKYNHHSIKKPKISYISEWYDKAKYIALCEGDDYWIDSKKMQKQVDFLDTHPDYNIYIHNAIRVLSDGTKRPFNYIKGCKTYSIIDVMCKKWFTPTASFLYRNNIVIPKEYGQKGANGDMKILYTNCLKGKLYYCEDLMSVYNMMTPGSMSVSTPLKKLYDKKIGLLKAFNKVTTYKYFWVTYPLIAYYSVRQVVKSLQNRS